MTETKKTVFGKPTSATVTEIQKSVSETFFPMREIGGVDDPISREMCQHYCDNDGKGLQGEEHMNPFLAKN